MNRSFPDLSVCRQIGREIMSHHNCERKSVCEYFGQVVKNYEKVAV